MVPSWTLFALTALFFIREVWMRSTQKPNDYDMGYRQAINNIAIIWNKDVKNHSIMVFSSSKLMKFLQDKLKGR